jgi:hypothetical protein
MMQELDASERLVMNYMSLKNGNRDLSKLTAEEILHCHVLEAELLTTAVLLFYREMNSGNFNEIPMCCSPLKIIEALDREQLSMLCDTFVQSATAQANEIIRGMSDVAE